MVYTVIICGDRNWTDRESISWFIKYILPSHTVIIQGGCRGADIISKEEGEKQGHKVITIKAEWDKYGLKAGPLRNIEMMKEKPNWVIAFHEDIENSKGTKHMISLAKENGTPWVVQGKTGVLDISEYCE